MRHAKIAFLMSLWVLIQPIGFAQVIEFPNLGDTILVKQKNSLSEVIRFSGGVSNSQLFPYYTKKTGTNGVPLKKIVGVRDFQIANTNDNIQTELTYVGDRFDLVIHKKNQIEVHEYQPGTGYQLSQNYVFQYKKYGLKGWKAVCTGRIGVNANLQGTKNDIILQKGKKISAFTRLGDVYGGLQLPFSGSSPAQRFKVLGTIDADSSGYEDILARQNKQLVIFTNVTFTVAGTNTNVVANFTYSSIPKKIYDLKPGDRVVGVFDWDWDEQDDIVIQNKKKLFSISQPQLYRKLTNSATVLTFTTNTLIMNAASLKAIGPR